MLNIFRKSVQQVLPNMRTVEFAYLGEHYFSIPGWYKKDKEGVISTMSEDKIPIETRVMYEKYIRGKYDIECTEVKYEVPDILEEIKKTFEPVKILCEKYNRIFHFESNPNKDAPPYIVDIDLEKLEEFIKEYKPL